MILNISKEIISKILKLLDKKSRNSYYITSNYTYNNISKYIYCKQLDIKDDCVSKIQLWFTKIKQNRNNYTQFSTYFVLFK